MRYLISLGMLDELGYLIKVESRSVKIVKGSMVVMKGINKNGIYSLLGSTIVGTVAPVAGSSMNNTMLWHKRLGHVNNRGLSELEKQGLLGDKKLQDLEFCETCVFGKTCRIKFGVGVQRTKGTLDYIHSDILGPSRTQSFSGARYFMTLVDDYSRKLWVFILKYKSDALEKFK